MQAGRLQIRMIPRLGLAGTGACCVNMFLGRDKPLTYRSNGLPVPPIKSRCGKGRWTGTRAFLCWQLQRCRLALMARTWSRGFWPCTLMCGLKISPDDIAARKSKYIEGWPQNMMGASGVDGEWSLEKAWWRRRLKRRLIQAWEGAEG